MVDAEESCRLRAQKLGQALQGDATCHHAFGEKVRKQKLDPGHTAVIGPDRASLLLVGPARGGVIGGDEGELAALQSLPKALAITLVFDDWSGFEQRSHSLEVFGCELKILGAGFGRDREILEPSCTHRVEGLARREVNDVDTRAGVSDRFDRRDNSRGLGSSRASGSVSRRRIIATTFGSFGEFVNE